MKQLRLRPIYGVLALLALMPLAGCADVFASNAVESFHATQANAPSTIEVHNPAGNLILDAWNKPSVQIDARKRGRDFEDVHAITISLERHGSTLVITSHLPASISNCSVEYSIHAPAGTNLDLHQSAGNLQASGFTRNVDASVSAGRLIVEMGALGGSQRVSLRTSVGELVLRVPSAANATIAASTSVGAIDTDFPLSVVRETVRQSANGTIGKGTAVVDLTNSTGAIRIQRE
jgi:hypothetical protein